jgi:uncharacterized protein YggE
MNLKNAILVLALSAVCAGPLSAQDITPDYDPMKRNLIFVSGHAELAVPVNRFSMAFGFDIEKGSFRDSQEASAKIIEGIASKAKGLGLSEVEIVKGWDLVRQSKISLGSKGRKISNRVIIKVSNFPLGRMHELIAQLIDGSLSVDGAVELQEVQVSLSDELENKKKEEAVLTALKNLQNNAKGAADALGRTLAAPKQVFISEDPKTMPVAADYAASGGYGGGEMMMSQRLLSVQKSFNVQSEIADHVKISVNVSGVYELE